MNTSQININAKPGMARKERRNAFSGRDILEVDPHILLSSARLARMFESGNRLLFAATMYEHIYVKTGNEKVLLKIESLAESASKKGNFSTSGAIYSKLFSITYQERFLKMAADCQESQN